MRAVGDFDCDVVDGEPFDRELPPGQIRIAAARLDEFAADAGDVHVFEDKLPGEELQYVGIDAHVGDGEVEIGDIVAGADEFGIGEMDAAHEQIAVGCGEGDARCRSAFRPRRGPGGRTSRRTGN